MPAKKEKINVYEIVTERILKMLDEGVAPWHRPWKSAGGALNVNSKRPYRGINAFLLAFAPYESPYWATFNGWKKLGGQVRKGEKSTLVVFWKINEYKDPSAPNGVKKVPMLRYYRVFNRDQVDGTFKIDNAVAQGGEHDPIESAEQVVENMPNRPSIKHGGSVASFTPLLDTVNMPKLNSFDTPEHYYSTMFHELGHSTGMSNRCKRGIEDNSGFGSESYSKEELVAEMTAAFVAGSIGMNIEVTIENSASYIKGWLSKLESEPKLVIQAAAQAQKAADYILNVKKDEAPAENEEVATTEPLVAA